MNPVDTLRFFRITRKRVHPAMEDLVAGVGEAWGKARMRDLVPRGGDVAIGVGSRGIDRIDEVTRIVCDLVKEAGGRPFVIPAMGCHGGAGAEGQAEILRDYGVVEERVGAPVRATMDVVELRPTDDGIPVYLDRYASEAQGIIVINRVKPHTDFEGPTESGILKMLAIGLGKYAGALAYHRVFFDRGHVPVIHAVARRLLEDAPVIGGIALIENEAHRISDVHALGSEVIFDEEPGLLSLARERMMSLPASEVDLLIVDEMGKNVSGAGIDTNVVGRVLRRAEPDPGGPQVRRIFVRSLTPESHGNAAGIGIVDITTERLVRAIDRRSTYTNVTASQNPRDGSVPIHFPSDREALAAALGTLGRTPPEKLRVMWIKNTAEIETLWASEAYRDSFAGREDLEVGHDSHALRFDERGDLLPMAMAR